MSKSAIKTLGIVLKGGNVLTTSHTITDARAEQIGNLYIANVTVTLTSAVSAWAQIFKLKGITIANSQYAFGYAGASTADLFYVGGGAYSGEVSCVRSLASGTQIKVAITLVAE